MHGLGYRIEVLPYVVGGTPERDYLIGTSVGDLALLVPSRGRPHNIARLIEAMNQTCRADTTLVVGVDDDDPALPDYRASDCELVVQQRRSLVRWLNLLAIPRAETYRFIGHIGDDNVPRTEGWDVKVIESLERQGDIGFCYGDDLDPGRPAGSLSLTAFMTSEVIRRLRYMGPPRIQHMYVDPVWFAWGTGNVDRVPPGRRPRAHALLDLQQGPDG